MTDVSDNEFEELPPREPAWMAASRATAYRKRLLAAGYLPLPVNGKAPPIAGWQDIEATKTIIDGWETNCSHATNTGILTRTTAAVDIDVLDAAVADELQQIAERMIGPSACPHRAGAEACDVVSRGCCRSISSRRLSTFHQTAARIKLKSYATASRLSSMASTQSRKRRTHGGAASPGRILSVTRCRAHRREGG